MHRAQQAQVADYGPYAGWGRPAIVKTVRLRPQIPTDVTPLPESAGAADRILTPGHVLYMRTRQALTVRNKGTVLPNAALDGISRIICDSLDKLLPLPEKIREVCPVN